MSWQQEYWQSIKSFDTEEKLDLYFYRPFGFLMAKLAKSLCLTPDLVTVLGVLFGLAATYFFYNNESTANLIIASALLIFAGVLDSADGQLARMVGGGTKFGLVLDGLADNIVFGAAYIASTMTLIPVFGSSMWLIAISAGICHSFQSAALDFYNREYLFFGYGKVRSDYWNPTNAEAKAERASSTHWKDKLFWILRYTWILQQNRLSTRTPEERLQLRKLVEGAEAEKLGNIYRDHNRRILRAWRLMGPNFHTIMILIFVFLRRFELYLLCVDIIGLMLALFLLRHLQLRQDRRFFSELRKQGLFI